MYIHTHIYVYVYIFRTWDWHTPFTMPVVILQHVTNLVEHEIYDYYHYIYIYRYIIISMTYINTYVYTRIYIYVYIFRTWDWHTLLTIPFAMVPGVTDSIKHQRRARVPEGKKKQKIKNQRK